MVNELFLRSMKFLNQMHDQVNILPICVSLADSEEWQIQTMSGEVS